MFNLLGALFQNDPLRATRLLCCNPPRRVATQRVVAGSFGKLLCTCSGGALQLAWPANARAEPLDAHPGLATSCRCPGQGIASSSSSTGSASPPPPPRPSPDSHRSAAYCGPRVPERAHVTEQASPLSHDRPLDGAAWTRAERDGDVPTRAAAAGGLPAAGEWRLLLLSVEAGVGGGPGERVSLARGSAAVAFRGGDAASVRAS